jgi:hypothetical protein
VTGVIQSVLRSLNEVERRNDPIGGAPKISG